MTVAELRAALEALPPEAAGWTVVLSQDAEGTAFSPLRDCAIACASRTSPHEPAQWSGDFVAEEDLGPQDVFWCVDALSLWPLR